MHDDTPRSQIEVQTDPFTEAELSAISDYRKSINGIADFVEGIEPQTLIRAWARLMRRACATCSPRWPTT